MIQTSEEKINAVLSRGVVDVIQKRELKKKLAKGKQLTIKLGIDPSGADLHIGHMVVIKKLKEFQDMGHKIVLLFGNFTGQIGDPTGKMEARKAKTKKQLEKNAEKYLDQVKLLLDIDKVEVRWNAEWLEKLSFADVVQLSSCFTVAQMMERDMFQDRVSKNMPISMHEFLYPLMQGYDSVAIQADLELGGTDQTFNLLAGRTIQKAYDQTPQDILTVPILEGTDGTKKMGKSENNYIAVDDAPNDMFGKVMSIPDNLIVKYFELATEIPLSEIDEIKQAIKDGDNPMEFKKRLGREIVTIYHSEEAAQKAEEHFTTVFSHHQVPDEIPLKKLDGTSMPLIDLIAENNLAPSKSQARRLVQQGAVRINEEKVQDIDTDINFEKEVLIQVGKRRFLRVIGK
ncbi:tyrosine--tRNA ligase [Candidatus Peregrinibacteria bacterium]|nr:tyrosine--tRNA ligase [Candidatus Peregrinibacteria bacterium]